MKEHAKVLGYTILGNAMLAFAICAFVVPNNFMLGGSNGIGLAVQHFFPVRLSVVSGVVNAILFVVGLIFLGKEFAAKSLLSTVIYPLIMAFFEELPLGTLFQEDKMICALFCGVMIGVGIGLVVRVGGSTGGMDIPPCILQKYRGIPVGRSLMFFDGTIILVQILLNGLDGVLYALLILIVSSIVVDKTVVSGEQKVQLIIISPAYEQIRREILNPLDCGVTMLDIETGYLGAKQKAILTVTYAKKYPEIRDAALKIDSKAFIVTSDVKNVNGKGYTLDRNGREK